MKHSIRTILALFIAQIVLTVWGSAHIFVQEANPFAVIAISVLLTGYCFRVLGQEKQTQHLSVRSNAKPWLGAVVGMFGLLLAYEELRKIWAKFPEPVKISDVLPQLAGQCELFFSGQFPYQPINLPTHQPFPVYMPMHWSPIQIANIAHIDIRWSGVILLLAAIGIAGYWLQKTHPAVSWKDALPAMLLLSLPVWGFVQWAKVDIAVSLETVVAAWYVILAAGLATRNRVLIAIGLLGALLSRYSLLFWLPLFAILLWRYEPKKYSFWIWGSVLGGVVLLFVLPFWAKDPTIISKIANYYTDGGKNSWLRPDYYSFLDGLSLNVHLRHWLPGTPEQNILYSRYPQIGVQVLMVALGVWLYHKKWRQQMDIYTFSLLALSIMPMLFYNFSPMLFKYYMLMPLSVSAVLCWKTIAVAVQTTPKTQ